MVVDGEEVEHLACQRVVAFAIEMGFKDIIIEGDSVNVIKDLNWSGPNFSQLGHIVMDIQRLVTSHRSISLSIIISLFIRQSERLEPMDQKW